MEYLQPCKYQRHSKYTDLEKSSKPNPESQDILQSVKKSAQLCTLFSIFNDTFENKHSHTTQG
jgi:hypothetical protein